MSILLNNLIFITYFMSFANNAKGNGDDIFEEPSRFDKANGFKDGELTDVPWIGLLRVTQKNKPDSVTNVVLVANNMAVGNALEVSKLNFNSWKSKTKVVFLNKKGLIWGCDVESYIMHDEFYKSQNTLAIIRLNNKMKYPWSPVRWSVVPYKPTENIYLIRFSDEGMRLKQIITKMKPYRLSLCKKFYAREGLDIESLQPQNYRCFTSTEDNGYCVYDAGMALATNNSGQWTLLGISTLGPGCSLPSRFIDFYPYYHWLVENTMVQTRKFIDDKSKIGYITQDFGDDRDKFILNMLDDDKIVMKIKKDIDDEQQVIGNEDCNDNGTLVYKDEGYVLVKPKQISTAVYSVSLHDLKLNQITCVRISIKCSKKSNTKIFFRKGYEQDDLEQMIKTIPYFKRGQTVAPKVLFVNDNYKIMRGFHTANIWFKFEFVKKAEIKVEFFGVHVPSTTTTERSFTTEAIEENGTSTRKPRPTRTYETHLAHGGRVI